MFSALKKKATAPTTPVKGDASPMVPVATPNVPSPSASPSATAAIAASSSIASATAANSTLAVDSGPSSTAAAAVNGILMVRVVEAKNLTGSTTEGRFYIVIEFDKNEFAAESASADSIGPRWSQRANFDVSRESEVVISLYQKTGNMITPVPKLPPASLSQNSRLQGKPRAPVAPTLDTLFIGAVKLNPQFSDQKMEDFWIPIACGSSTGEIHVQLLFRKLAAKKHLSIDDFDLLKVIGKGSFGKVMQVRKKDTGRIYAMKIIKKANIVERDEVEHTLAERNVLTRLQNPFIVNMKFSFQSPDKLYLVLAFVNGGELFHHLQNEGRFSEDRAKFYISELLVALECLHNYNIIYRDLKPENILLDYSGHLALCDFGLCKLNMQKGDKTNTFCGTPEYLAPELLMGEGYTQVVDWWTLGVLLYEMMVGLPPFYSEDQNEMYRRIVSDPLRFPDAVDGVVISREARDLLTRLLERDPTKRFGANGAQEIRKHPFFANVDFERLYRKQITPPFRPNVESATDTSNFDEEFTSEVPSDSLMENAPALSSSVQDQFQGFTYIGNEGNAMYGASVQNRATIPSSCMYGAISSS